MLQINPKVSIFITSFHQNYFSIFFEAVTNRGGFFLTSKICYNISMKLIVGLGNPGNEYNLTRHNFGFLALDFYFKAHGLEFEKSEKFHAKWQKSGQTIFIEPQTYYNDVGSSIQEFMNYYKISLGDLLVLCDDFNLDFGTLRYREKGTDGGNNGLKSTIRALSTTDFKRLRLGTANNTLRKKMGDVDFVLGRFTPEEREKLPEVLTDIAKRIDDFIQE